MNKLLIILPLVFLLGLITVNAEFIINISSVIDSFEFDATNGETPTSLVVSQNSSSSIIATFYDGVTSDGFVTTFEILNDGTIITPTIDLFEFDTTAGQEPSVLKISDTTFLVVYKGALGDGFAKTIEILNDGTIVGTIETFEIEETDLEHPNVFFIQEQRNLIGVTSSQTTTDGILGLGFILDNGTINRTDRFIYNDTQSNRADSTNVTNNIVLIAYHADIGGDNFGGALETIGVLDNGSVTDTIDYEIFDAGQGDSPSIVRIDADTFAIFYEGVGTVGRVKTFDIGGTGLISSEIDSFAYDTGDGELPNVIPIGNNFFVNVYDDANTQGQLVVIEIMDDGSINTTISANTTYEDTLSNWQEIINVKDDIFLITYQGVALDGFVKTINISVKAIVIPPDTTPPVITLITPSNNTRNNTHPIDITFSVLDNTPGNLICNLNNNTNTFDSGTFFQAVTSTLTLDTGLAEIDQEFPNLNLVCFDNSPANNSATLLFNITLDNIQPVITVISPSDLSSFNSEVISSISVKGDCEDNPVFRYNITITNTSNTIFAKGSETVVSNVISIDESLSLSGLGAGTYTVTHVCSDPHTKQNILDYILKKNTSDSKLIWLTPSGNEIQLKYSTPPKNPVTVLSYSSTKSPDNSKYTFYYKLNATEDGTEYTWSFELENNKNQVQYISDSPFAGHFIMENNFLDMEFEGNEDATYSITLNGNNNYEIEITTTKTELNFTSVGELNTEIVITTFEVLIIPQVEDLFKVGVCRTDIGSVLMLILFFLLSLFFIWLGLSANIGFIGFFGAIMMMVLSWFIAACIAIFALIMALLSLVLIVFFVIRFIGFKNAPYQP